MLSALEGLDLSFKSIEEDRLFTNKSKVIIYRRTMQIVLRLLNVINSMDQDLDPSKIIEGKRKLSRVRSLILEDVIQKAIKLFVKIASSTGDLGIETQSILVSSRYYVLQKDDLIKNETKTVIMNQIKLAILQVCEEIEGSNLE